MKDFKKFINISILILCVNLSAIVYGQSQENMVGYNSALYSYNNGDYSNALATLGTFMGPMEANPSAWVNGGENYVILIFKVYRLAAACYYQSGDNASSDIIVDNLVYVLSNFYYESDIINRYNNTSISQY